MAKSAHIALFQPLESALQNIASLFRREEELTVKQISDISSLHEIINQGDNIDVIVIPSLLIDRASAVHLCIKIKADEQLSFIPIILLSFNKDLPSISTFYGAGADIVLIPPFEPELLFLQITSLIRYRTSLNHERGILNRDLGLRQAMVKTLHLVQEPILIMDPKPNIVFANRSARELLKIFDAPDSEEEKRVFSSIQSIISEKLVKTSFYPVENNRVVIDVRQLPCAHNSSINAQLQIAPLEIENQGLVAYCVTISDTDLPSELSDSIRQAERIQSLALLLFAGCGRLIGSATLGKPGMPLSQLENLFISEPVGCSISTVITSLVEVLDLVLSSKSSVKVNLTHDYLVDIKTSDLIQLTGHMIFYAISQTAQDCDIEIKAAPLTAKRAINLSVEATIPIRSITIAQEKLRASFRSELQNSATLTRYSGKLSNSITLARQIARNYASDLIEENLAPGKIILSTIIPIR